MILRAQKYWRETHLLDPLLKQSQNVAPKVSLLTTILLLRPAGIIGSVVDFKFFRDAAVQPISSGSFGPYRGEYGTACLLSAVGRPCKENGKDVCAPDATDWYSS